MIIDVHEMFDNLKRIIDERDKVLREKNKFIDFYSDERDKYKKRSRIFTVVLVTAFVIDFIKYLLHYIK